MLKVAIVMPAYNEERRIGPTLDSYSEYFNRLVSNKVADYELLVVINNTKDRTEEIVKGKMKKNSRLRYLNFVKGGKGYAVIEGFKHFIKNKEKLIGFVDADMATSPEAFFELVRNIDNYDGIIASRYIEGATVKPKPTIQRFISSRIFNALIRAILFLPYRDTQCGAKVFKREAIVKVISKLSMSKWAFDVELIYTLRKFGFSVKEYPTKWADKQYSTINFMTSGPWMALGVIRLRLLNSPLKRFIRVYDKFIGFIPR